MQTTVQSLILDDDQGDAALRSATQAPSSPANRPGACPEDIVDKRTNLFLGGGCASP